MPTRYELSKSNPHLNPQCQYCTSPETFLHLLKCHNPISQQFRVDLKDQIRMYLFTKAIPEEFQTLFCGTLRKWTAPPRTSERTQYDKHHLIIFQDRIGWHLLLKRFLSIEWRLLLDQQHRKYSDDTTSKSVDVLAGLLGIIWKAEIQLWTDHVTKSNVPSPSLSIRHNDK